jgi:hypothetical protein
MIFHDSRNLYYRSPIGAVPTQSFVRLAIDVEKIKFLWCVYIHGKKLVVQYIII